MTWGQVRPRETGEAQLAVIGKGNKPRNVLLPAELATALAQMRGDAPADARVFPITERRINYIVKSAAKRAGINHGGTGPARVTAHSPSEAEFTRSRVPVRPHLGPQGCYRVGQASWGRSAPAGQSVALRPRRCTLGSRTVFGLKSPRLRLEVGSGLEVPSGRILALLKADLATATGRLTGQQRQQPVRCQSDRLRIRVDAQTRCCAPNPASP